MRSTQFSDFTDEQLIVEFSRTLDEKFYTELYERNYKSLVKTIRNRYTLGDTSSAEDIVQGVFVKLLKHHATFDPRFMFRPWICSIAIRDAINWVKGCEIRNAISIDAIDGVDIEDDRLPNLDIEDQEELDFVMTNLSPEMQLAIRTVYLEDMTFDAAATVTGLSPNTLKTQVTRGIRRLQNDLKVA